MSRATDGLLAEARRIGEDVEFLVVRAIEPLRLVDDGTATYDAETTALLAPDRIGGSLPVRFGLPVVEAGTPVEIKAALVETSNGPGQTRSGRWYFRGPDDGQHAKLLDASAVYALAVYRETPDGRDPLAVIVVPASVVDEHLRRRWHPSNSEDGQVAKLSWTQLLDREVVHPGGVA